jgi:hypothetical protein
MKIHTAAVTSIIAAVLVLSAPAYAAEEKKPSTGDKLLKGASDTLKSVTGTEDTVKFQGRISNVDAGAREFRTTGSTPGLYKVTGETKITRGDASVSLNELKKGDTVSGTAHKTGADTFRAVSVTARPGQQEAPAEKSVLERLIPGEKKTEKKTEKK